MHGVGVAHPVTGHVSTGVCNVPARRGAASSLSLRNHGSSAALLDEALAKQGRAVGVRMDAEGGNLAAGVHPTAPYDTRGALIVRSSVNSLAAQAGGR